MVFKRPSRSLEGEKGEFNSHRKTKVGNKNIARIANAVQCHN